MAKAPTPGLRDIGPARWLWTLLLAAAPIWISGCADGLTAPLPAGSSQENSGLASVAPSLSFRGAFDERGIGGHTLPPELAERPIEDLQLQCFACELTGGHDEPPVICYLRDLADGSRDLVVLGEAGWQYRAEIRY